MPLRSRLSYIHGANYPQDNDGHIRHIVGTDLFRRCCTLVVAMIGCAYRDSRAWALERLEHLVGGALRCCTDGVRRWFGLTSRWVGVQIRWAPESSTRGANPS